MGEQCSKICNNSNMQNASEILTQKSHNTFETKRYFKKESNKGITKDEDELSNYATEKDEKQHTHRTQKTHKTQRTNKQKKSVISQRVIQNNDDISQRVIQNNDDIPQTEIQHNGINQQDSKQKDEETIVSQYKLLLAQEYCEEIYKEVSIQLEQQNLEILKKQQEEEFLRQQQEENMVLPLNEFNDNIFLEEEIYKEVTLVEKIVFQKNCCIFKFSFENKRKFLGVPIGQYVNLRLIDHDTHSSNYNQVYIRSFFPISEQHSRGYFQILAKIYYPNEEQNFTGGGFTMILDQLQIGQPIQISGPKGYFSYKSQGVFEIDDQVLKIKNLAFVVGGMGIIPFLQIVKIIQNEQFKDIKISLIYSCKYQDDIIERDYLDKLSKQKNIKVEYTLTQELPDIWRGFTGRITKSILQCSIPNHREENLLICVAGSESFSGDMVKYLKQMKYSNGNLYVFE